MNLFTTSTLLALALGVLAVQPSYGQGDSDAPENRWRDARAEQRLERAEQRRRDARQDRAGAEQTADAEQRNRQQRREGGIFDRQRGEEQRWRAERRRDERSSQRADQRPEQQPEQQQSRGQVTGEVVQTKRVDIRGTDQQRLVVLLKTDGGSRVPVDLGDANRLGDEEPSRGDEITIRGRLVRIGDRAVVMGEELQGQGRRIVRIDQQDPRQSRDRDGEGRSYQRNGDGGERQDRQPRDRDGGFYEQQQSARDRQNASQNSRGGLGVALAPDHAANGVRVIQVLPGSPAADAGIQPGDVITRVGGTDVSTPQELIRAVVEKRPGERVDIQVDRNGQRRHLRAQLAERQEALNPRSQGPDPSQRQNSR